MKTLLLFVLLSLPVAAATQTATVTVPNSQSVELAVLVDAWIEIQDRAGTTRFPGATRAIRRQAVLDWVLRDGLLRIVMEACSEAPDKCPAALKAKQDVKRTAEDEAAQALIDLVK